MAEITEAGVQEKLDKGETLSKEETAFVMSGAPEGTAQAPVDPGKEDDVDFEKDDIDKAPSGKKDEAAEKPGEDDKGDEAGKAEKKPEDEGKAKPSEEPAPDKKKTDDGTFHGKIERELDKPDGQEDLSGYNEREKGLFYEMKKSRKRAQKAEEDRDALMFERIKEAKLKQDDKPDKPAEEEDEDLFGKEADPEDFPTVGKLREITKKMNEREDQARRARDRQLTVRVSEMNARQLVELRRENGKDAPDYDEVMELANIIVQGNAEYEKKIYDAYVRGKNAAILTYDIIRSDPRFTSLFKPSAEAPKTDKAEEGKKTLDKINANANKPKTSGSGGTGGGEGGEEYTVDQLLRMTTAQFRKVPKSVRDKLLYNG